MNNSQNTQNLMQKIALLLDSEEVKSDNSALMATLAKINARLDKIEERMDVSPKRAALPVHPSLQKIRLIEEIVDEAIAGQNIPKTCDFEPHRKPCDNCSLCNTRGF